MIIGYKTCCRGAGLLGRTGPGPERARMLLDPDNFNMRYSFACALIIELAHFEAALDLLVLKLRAALRKGASGRSATGFRR